MNDLISREALKEQFNGVPDSKDKDIALMLIDNAPAVDTYTIEDIKEIQEKSLILGAKLAQRPQGEWVYHERENELLRYKCSQCGVYHSPTNYCPCCGASMKGGEKSDT